MSMKRTELNQSLLDEEEQRRKTEPDESTRELTNTRIVYITGWLFLVFVVAEIIGAVASNSLYLIGDAAAMSVDVVSYACSAWGERVKDKTGAIDSSTRMWINVYIPFMSVVALLAVSAYITVEAVERVMDTDGDDDEVDVTFLYIFAGGNLLIDIVSAGMLWWKRDSAFVEGSKKRITSVSFALMPSTDEYNEEHQTGGEENSWNTNMLSVLAHTGGDTLRTVSALVAAAWSSIDGTSGTLTDAWACIVVTFTIVVGVIPLLSEIWKAYERETATPLM